MDYSFWFYTLSAIPQTLAALTALTATFAIFKLNFIEEMMDSDIYHIKIFLPKLDKNFRPHFERRDAREVIGPLENALQKINRDNEYLGLGQDNFEKLQKVCKEIIKYGFGDDKINKQAILDYMDYTLGSLKNSYKNKTNIIKYILSCLFIAGIPILISLLLLSMFFVNNFTIFLFSVIVGFAGTSVVYTLYVIFKIAKLSR